MSRNHPKYSIGSLVIGKYVNAMGLITDCYKDTKFAKNNIFVYMIFWVKYYSRIKGIRAQSVLDEQFNVFKPKD